MSTLVKVLFLELLYHHSHICLLIPHGNLVLPKHCTEGYRTDIKASMQLFIDSEA